MICCLNELPNIRYLSNHSATTAIYTLSLHDALPICHWIAPLERAGCYAPGGRYPLPSSVLMTAVTARAAGVNDIWVASPKPGPMTLAAAAVAGADGLLAAGGAHAIAALAFGAGPIAPC